MNDSHTATSLHKFKHQRQIAKYDAMIAKEDAAIAWFSNWLKEKGSAASPAHCALCRKTLRKSVALRKRIIALRHEQQQFAAALARAGGNLDVLCQDVVDHANQT